MGKKKQTKKDKHECGADLWDVVCKLQALAYLFKNCRDELGQDQEEAMYGVGVVLEEILAVVDQAKDFVEYDHA